jgi:multicomponent Na+:H+ antiporter subunit B
VSRSSRLVLFAAGGVGLGALLVWGLVGLPDFGHYAGPYGDLISARVVPERHMANAITALVFDYRGLDTMGEELILFAAASGTAMLLRETRGASTRFIVDRVRSDGVNAVGAVAAIATLVLGLLVVAHAFLTPGGGFQGGVVLAGAVVLLFLAVDYRSYDRLARTVYTEPVEAIGAGGYVVLGLISLVLGFAFLESFLSQGTFNTLTSGGSPAIVNWSSALAVAGGFAVIFAEYLQEVEGERFGRRGRTS